MILPSTNINVYDSLLIAQSFLYCQPCPCPAAIGHICISYFPKKNCSVHKHTSPNGKPSSSKSLLGYIDLFLYCVSLCFWIAFVFGFGFGFFLYTSMLSLLSHLVLRYYTIDLMSEYAMWLSWIKCESGWFILMDGAYSLFVLVLFFLWNWEFWLFDQCLG